MMAANDIIRQDRHYRPGRKGRIKDDCETTAFDGVIEPSDQAFVDLVLNGMSEFNVEELHLYSDMDRSTTTDNELVLHHRHRLEYKGDVIWHLETVCRGGGLSVSGESSRCSLHTLHVDDDGAILRIRVCHKGQQWRGDGLNSRQVHDYRLNGIVRQSAEKYAIQMGLDTTYGVSDSSFT